jgi:hypothetical protein
MNKLRTVNLFLVSTGVPHFHLLTGTTRSLIIKKYMSLNYFA